MDDFEFDYYDEDQKMENSGTGSNISPAGGMYEEEKKITDSSNTRGQTPHKDEENGDRDGFETVKTGGVGRKSIFSQHLMKNKEADVEDAKSIQSNQMTAANEFLFSKFGTSNKSPPAKSQTRSVVTTKEIVKLVDAIVCCKGNVYPTSMKFWDNMQIEGVSGKRAVTIYRNHINKRNEIKGISLEKNELLRKKLHGLANVESMEEDKLQSIEQTNDNEGKPLNAKEIEEGSQNNTEEMEEAPQANTEEMEEAQAEIDRQCRRVFRKALKGNYTCRSAIRTIMDLQQVAHSLSDCFVAPKVQNAA